MGVLTGADADIDIENGYENVCARFQTIRTWYLILIIFMSYKSEHATYAIKVFSSLVAAKRRNL